MPLNNYTIRAKFGNNVKETIIPEISKGRAIKAFVQSLSNEANSSLTGLEIIDTYPHEVFGNK